MTVDGLARELGIAPSTLRAWLRKAYPRDPSERGRPWRLTEEHVAAARARFGEGRVKRRAPGANAGPVAEAAPLDAPPAAEAAPRQPPRRRPLGAPVAAAASPRRRRGRRRLSAAAEYVLDVVDELVGEPGWREHQFRWLTAEDGEGPWAPSKLLAVDAYYPSRRLVVLYRDRRLPGDRRREKLIPEEGLALAIVTPDLLATDRRGRLARRRDADAAALQGLIERAGAGAKVGDDRRRARIESSVSRAWQLQVAGLAIALALAGAVLLALFRGDAQFLLNLGGALLAFALAFDLYARVIGVLAARAYGQPGWAIGCGVLGSPAVAAHAALERHGPAAPEAGSLAGLVALTVGAALLLATLAGAIGG